MFGKEYFSSQEKVREFCRKPVKFRKDLEKTWKVKEKSGKLKINGFGRQSLENLFLLFKRGERCTFS